MGRPKGSKNKPKPLEHITEIIKYKGIEGDLPNGITLEPLRITIREVLKGETMEGVKAELLIKGYDCGRDKVYNLIRIAKAKIAERAERDLDLNFAWVQENLMDLHRKCLNEEDNKLRLQVIEKLMKLWQLDVTRIESVQLTITSDKLKEYEQMLFGG